MAIIHENYNEIYYSNFSNLDRPGCMTQLGQVLPRQGYQFKNRFVSRYFFDYVVSGKGYIEFDGVLHNVSAGDLIYIRKATVVSYWTDEDDPYEKLWIGADGMIVESMIDSYIGRDRLVIRHDFSPELFIKLKSIIASNGYDERRIMRTIFDLILRTAEFPEIKERECDEGEALAERIRQYIDDRLTENFTLEEISEYFHVSKRHVYRVFNEKYHTTPKAYHNDIRLVAALRYLSETSTPISEIASTLGYCDQSFFSTSFRRKYGVNPTAYRKSSDADDLSEPE